MPAEKLHRLIKRRAMRIRDVESQNGSNLKRHTTNWLADNFIIVETNTGSTLETDTLGGWLLDSSKIQNADLGEKLTNCPLFIRADFNDATGVSMFHIELRSWDATLHK